MKTIATLILGVFLTIMKVKGDISYDSENQIPGGKSQYVSGNMEIQTTITAREVCSTSTCQIRAQRILTNLNTSMDPCDNFYDYVCGNWAALHPIPDSETETGTLYELDDLMSLVVQGILSESISATSFASEATAKNFYKQCKNQDEIEKLRGTPLIQLLNRVIGGWPVITPGWNSSSFNLLNSLINIRVFGQEPLFSLYVDQHLENPTQNMIFLSDPGGYTTRDVLESDVGDTFTKSYTTYLFNATSLLLRDNGDSRDVSAVSAELNAIMDLSKFIILSEPTAAESGSISILRGKTKLATIDESLFFRSDFAQNFTTYLKAVFQIVGLSDQITADMEIGLGYPSFYEKLDMMLLDFQDDAGKRQLANYIGWWLISNNINYLSKDYRDARAAHVQRTQGQTSTSQAPVAKQCAADAVAALSLAVGALYLREFVPADLKTKATVMVNDLTQGFQQLLNDATWMDNVTFTEATKKLTAMIEMVAYPDVMVNNISAIDNEYKEIAIGKTYFDTLLGVNTNQNIRYLRILTEQNTRGNIFRDGTDITRVNAFNAPNENEIAILAAILQIPLYVPDDPQYLNYGAVGFIVGHEITHGFDDSGNQFDDQGQLRSWWTESTRDVFNARQEGLVDQYNNYSLPFGNVDGKLTVRENTADGGGIKAAYRAYKLYRMRLSQPEPAVIGLEKFTNDQTFFLSFAHSWCASVRPETARLKLLNNPHSPERFRVIGSLSNMAEFSAAFHCPMGSNMNPLTKQGVW